MQFARGVVSAGVGRALARQARSCCQRRWLSQAGAVRLAHSVEAPTSVSAALRWGSFVGTLACLHLFHHSRDEERLTRDSSSKSGWFSFRSLFESLVPTAVVGLAAGCPVGADGGGGGSDEPYTSDLKTNRYMSSVPRGPRPRKNYAEYLNLYYLLDIQRDDEGISSDEQHFITVHQIFELWFKLVLRELTEARDILSAGHVAEEDVPRVVHKLTRCTKIFSLLSQQWKVVETLAPQDFLAFRHRLGTASGFESFQIRELEMLLGLKQETRSREMNPVEHFKGMRDRGGEADEKVFQRIVTRATEETIDHAVKLWLSRTPIYGSLPGDPADDVLVERFVSNYLKAYEFAGQETMQRFANMGDMERVAEIKERTRKATASARKWLQPGGKTDRARAALLFIESHRELPMLAWPRQLLDAVAELEQSILLFRFCHARMVERVIGRRTGTGGSSGVAYLDQTTGYRIFHDLWTVRSLLIRREIIPDIESRAASSFYQFRGDTASKA